MRVLKRKFGDILRQKRKAKGFATQEQFANALGVDQSRIARWESGAQSPNYEHIARICEVLKVPEEYFAAEAQAPNDMDWPQLLTLISKMQEELAGFKAESERLKLEFSRVKSAPQPEIQELVSLFEHADKSTKEVVMNILRSLAATQKRKAK